jgi:hypothetical protein
MAVGLQGSERSHAVGDVADDGVQYGLRRGIRGAVDDEPLVQVDMCRSFADVQPISGQREPAGRWFRPAQRDRSARQRPGFRAAGGC